MSDTLPAPFTPPDCNLQDFHYMELHVQRLRDSKFAATPNGDAFRAGVLLWCAAWHQVPAASLPDDDIELAKLAGFGHMQVGVKAWKKLRAEALHGFVKCADGRLYHEVIAEKALSAWQSRLEHAYDKLLDRTRKENKRRADHGVALIEVPTFIQWNSSGRPTSITPEIPTPSGSVPPERQPPSGGIPAENALKGKGKGKGNREGDGKGDSPVVAAKRGTKQCPAEFQVTKELVRWALGGVDDRGETVVARCPQLTLDDLKRETEKLRNHTFPRAIVDWSGAWRNWVMKADEDAQIAAQRFGTSGRKTGETAFSSRERSRIAEATGGLLSTAPANKPLLQALPDERKDGNATALTGPR